MHIHGAFFDEAVTSPHAVQQLITTVNTVWMRHEVVEQAKFGRSYGDRPIIYGNAVIDWVQGETAGLHRRIIGVRTRKAW
jgi:hypothetical protein